MNQLISNINWAEIHDQLNVAGWALLDQLLTSDECDGLSALYQQKEIFRSKVIMSRYNFGQGEYQYFSYPLPSIVTELREYLYPPLADIANHWHQKMNSSIRFPDTHQKFIERCHQAGQIRPTPLILKYQQNDYNCLHQDLYGEHVFPLQVVILLSEPGTDYTGGEFIITEQRPRMQTRAEVIPLRKGSAAIIPVHHRPKNGTKGIYRVNMRHGVSRLRSGQRYATGIIFHDAN